jgi:hypothetical protein
MLAHVIIIIACTNNSNSSMTTESVATVPWPPPSWPPPVRATGASVLQDVAHAASELRDEKWVAEIVDIFAVQLRHEIAARNRMISSKLEDISGEL